jgi:hypothetical protein
MYKMNINQVRFGLTIAIKGGDETKRRETAYALQKALLNEKPLHAEKPLCSIIVGAQNSDSDYWNKRYARIEGHEDNTTYLAIDVPGTGAHGTIFNALHTLGLQKADELIQAGKARNNGQDSYQIARATYLDAMRDAVTMTYDIDKVNAFAESVVLQKPSE